MIQIIPTDKLNDHVIFDNNASHVSIHPNYGGSFLPRIQEIDNSDPEVQEWLASLMNEGKITNEPFTLDGFSGADLNQCAEELGLGWTKAEESWKLAAKKRVIKKAFERYLADAE